MGNDLAGHFGRLQLANVSIAVESVESGYFCREILKGSTKIRFSSRFYKIPQGSKKFHFLQGSTRFYKVLQNPAIF